jgi:hypothetical protein
MYKAVKAYGHQAYIVASADNQSGKGGTVAYTTSRNLTVNSEFGIFIPASYLIVILTFCDRNCESGSSLCRSGSYGFPHLVL